ncbi:hypothetical protein [Vibrio alginolyticus]|uniref:hypothetical protein n=1 Tax=Vibrio alginolyticus TaxID=663 RepID=UPI00375474D9
MSTQEIGALIGSVNEMTATVAGKMGDIDKKVDEAKGDFDQFIATADDRYVTRTKISVPVGGDSTKFYPVYIPAQHGGVARVEISRYAHQDGQWAGAMTAVFDVQNNAWSGFPDFLLFNMYRLGIHPTSPEAVKTDGFIGHIESGSSYVYGMLIWLRGGHSYDVSSSLINLSNVVVHDAEVTSHGVFNKDIHVFNSGFHINASGIEQQKVPIDARNLTTVPSINYVRGL